MIAESERSAAVTLRRYPHPFRAMLAISNDVDRTTLRRFRELHRFLNTTAETPMGRGLRLDVAGSMWVYKHRGSGDPALLSPAPGSWETTPEADELTAYTRAGWIDTLHTYGHFAPDEKRTFERRDAQAAIAELRGRGLWLRTWVGRGGRSNPQNFGTRDWALGDVPGSAAYHTDLLLDYGVRFAWDEKQTATFGAAELLAPLELRDGRRIWGFRRFTQMTGEVCLELAERHGIKLAYNERGVPRAVVWWPRVLHYQLAEANLRGLIERGQSVIVAQRLGAVQGEARLGADAIEALQRLARLHREGRILVTRTSRLLEYERVARHLEYRVRTTGHIEIDIVAVRDPVLGTFVPTLEQLRGVTFNVPDPDRVTMFLGGRRIPNRELAPVSEAGRGATLGVRWFAPERTDHSAPFAT